MSDREAPPPRPAYSRVRGEGGEDAWLPPAEPQRPRTLADELEPGSALRSEMGLASAPEERRVPERLAPFHFTGDGGEYFRIWIVNLLLTVVTLGIYSAWAKVRKTRYFWQNTRLEGHAFDYHGDPRAILFGRIIALVLLAAYSFGFRFSRTAGLATVAVLLLVGPWLFMRAQRFRLVNSSWRGLRFGFDMRLREAYEVVLPPLVIWFSGAVLGAVASDQLGLVGSVGVLTSIMLPWMHHRLKSYQHRRARFGDREFDFLPAARGFYAVYFKAGLVAALGALAGMLAFVAVTFAVGDRSSVLWIIGMTMATVPFVLLVVYLVGWPYFAARMQALVWSHTRLGDVRFGSAIAFWPLFALTVKNVLLTIVTAGLYWPFAAVAFARYRVECMRTESDTPLAMLAQSTSAQPGAATGDAALDAFGLDIGL